MVEEARQLVVPRLVSELGGRPVEVGDDALGHEPVDRVVQPPLEHEHVPCRQRRCAPPDEPPEHAPEQEELGHDVPRMQFRGRLVGQDGGRRRERAHLFNAKDLALHRHDAPPRRVLFGLF